MSLKVGIVGLRRGRSFYNVFRPRKDSEVAAVCDVDEERAEAFAREQRIPRTHTDYGEFLQEDLDAVVVATPLPYHAEHVVHALESGKHVLSEVPAAYTLEECERIVRTVERTKRTYMLAENACYFAFIQTWRHMIEQGRLGRIIYAEAEYVHDCRSLMVDRDEAGKRTWRASLPPIHYCTHSLGPILYLLGEDRCVSVSGLSTGCHVAPELEAIDMEVGLFEMASGAVVKILCGFSIVREPPMNWYTVYGTKGTLESARCRWDKVKGYFEDIPNLQDMIPYPLGVSHTKTPPEATAGGHGTTEYFMVDDFVRAVLEGTKPPIDVYRAMDFTVPGICAHRSAQLGGKRIEVPDYR